MRNTDSTAATITWIAGIVAVLLVVLPPASMFLHSYTYATNRLDAEATSVAARISRFVSIRPETWQLDGARLNLLANEARQELERLEETPHSILVVQRSGDTVILSGQAIEELALSVNKPIHDFGREVGRVTVTRTIHHILADTAVAAVLGLVLALIVFFPLRILPLRALRRSLADLAQEKGRSDATLGSIGDAVITVNASGKVENLNPWAESLTTWTTSDALGLTIDQVFSPVTDVSTIQADVLHQGRLSRRFAPALPVEFVVTAIDEGGQVSGYVIAFRDISERLRAADDLRRSQERYKILIESSVLGVLVHRHFEPLFANHALAEMYGYSDPEEILQMDRIDVLFAPEEQSRIWGYHEARLRGELAPVDYEFVGVKADGTRFWLNNRSMRIDWDGEYAIQTTLFDVTDRKNMVDALRRSEERFRELAQLLPEIVYEMDRSGTLTFVNQTAFDTTGYAQKDLDRGFPALDLFVPEDRQRASENIQHILAGKPIESHEYRALRKDGSIFYVRARSVPIIRDGKAVGIRGILVDITDRREAEEALRESEDRFRSLVELAPDAIFVHAEGVILYANAAMARMLAAAGPEDVVGRRNFDLIDPRFHKQTRERLQMLAEGGPDHLPAIRLKIQPLAGPPLDVEAVSGRTTFKRHPAVWTALRDVTEQVRFESRLREARDEAEQASRAKTRFLAAASHDLRQPIQALNMFIGVLAGRKQEERNRTVIDRIEGSLEALEGLLDALLDVSKLEAGVIVPATEDILVAPLFERLENEFKPLAEMRGLELRMVNCTAAVHSDPILLERILRNLLSNALRYTPEGRVLLGCRRQGGTLRIQVCDTGIGIPPEHLNAIFREFHQVDNLARDRRKGLGLGLAIVDRLSRLLDHPIDVASTPGKGAVFSVSVPMVDRAPEKPHPLTWEALESLDGARVLVIDDDQSVLDSLRLQLEAWGCRTVTAHSGREALDKVADDTPDVIVADYRLGDQETGIQAVQDLRGALGIEVPACLITGVSVTIDEPTVSEFKLLYKPLSPRELRNALGRILIPA